LFTKGFLFIRDFLLYLGSAYICFIIETMTDPNAIVTETSSFVFVVVLLIWTGVFGRDFLKISPRLKLLLSLVGLSVSAFFLSAAFDTYNRSDYKNVIIFIPSSFLIGYSIIYIIKAIKAL